MHFNRIDRLVTILPLNRIRSVINILNQNSQKIVGKKLQVKNNRIERGSLYQKIYLP